MLLFFNLVVFVFFFSGVWEYIEKIRDQVHDLERRVQAAKDNVEAIGQLMTKWCDAPLYQRKGERKEGLLNIEVWCASCCLMDFLIYLLLFLFSLN